MKNFINTDLFRKIYFWTGGSFLFVTPLSVAATNMIFALMTVLLIISLFDKSSSETLLPQKGLQQWFYVVSVLVFIAFIYAAFRGDSFLNSAEKTLRNISFVILPLYILRYKTIFSNQKHKIFTLFVAGNLVASLACIGYAGYSFIFSDAETSVFFYKEFSIFRHPGFFATFISISAILAYAVIICEKVKIGMREKLLIIFSISIFFLTIFLLSSRSGFLMMFVAIIMIVVHYSLNSKSILVKVSLVLFSVVFLILILNNPRFEMLIKAVKSANITTNEKGKTYSDARITVWRSAIPVISENFYLGVGTDRVIKTLAEEHKIERYKNFSTHNQFLNLFIAAGVIGFLILLSYFVLLIIISFSSRNRILLMTVVIVGLSLMFEALFESVAGSFFFPFLLSLQVFSAYSKDSK